MQIEQPSDQHPHLPRRPPFRLVVNRHDAAHVQWRFGVLTQHFVLRDLHPSIDPSSYADDTTSHHHAGSHRQQLFKEWLIEEHDLDRPCLILHCHLKDRETPVPCALRFAAGNCPADRGLRPDRKASDGGDHRSIFIPPGHRPERILHRRNAHTVQERCPLWADSLRKSNRHLPQLGRDGPALWWRRRGFALRLIPRMSRILCSRPERAQNCRGLPKPALLLSYGKPLAVLDKQFA